MPDFKERKPPVLDDIIEPGLAEKARPAADDSQPSLWGEEEPTAENTGSPPQPGVGDIKLTAVNIYDTMEIELTPEVSTLDDDFDIDNSLDADSPRAELRPDNSVAGQEPVQTAEPELTRSIDTRQYDNQVMDEDENEYARPAPFETTTGAFDDPREETGNRIDEVESREQPDLDRNTAEPDTEAAPFCDESPAEAAVTAVQEPETRDAADDPGQPQAAEPSAPAPEVEALTNSLVRALLPEIELLMRKRIHEILDKSLSGDLSGQDKDPT